MPAAGHSPSTRVVWLVLCRVGKPAASTGGAPMSDNTLSPRIEQFAPELEHIVSASERIEYLADGYGGAQGPAEGPLGGKEGGYLLVSDIHNHRRMECPP